MLGTILKLIWGIFGSTLIQIALNTGLPAALEWLLTKGLPKKIADGIISILKAALEAIEKVISNDELTPAEKKAQVRAIKRQAKEEGKKHCSGVGCPPSTK